MTLSGHCARNRSVFSSGALTAHEMTIEQDFRSPNRPDKGRNPTYRAGSRREVWYERPSCYHRRQLAGAIWGISVEGLHERILLRGEPWEWVGKRRTR